MMEPAIEYTPRQKSLLDKLVEACKKIETIDLPIQIDEVHIFGSFIRGKAAPKDLDVMLIEGNRSEPEDDLLHLFSGSNRVGKIFWEYFKPLEFENPSAAIQAFYGAQDERGKLFSLWMSKYSWAKLYRESFGTYIPSRDLITKDLLRERGLSLEIRKPNDLTTLKAKTLILAWSRRGSRDVRKNIETTLANRSQILMAEYSNFAKQEAQINFTYETCLKYLELRRSTEKAEEEFVQSWSEDKRKSIIEFLANVSLVVNIGPAVIDVGPDLDPSVSQVVHCSLEELSKITEEKRQLLKLLNTRLLVLEYILSRVRHSNQEGPKLLPYDVAKLLSLTKQNKEILLKQLSELRVEC